MPGAEVRVSFYLPAFKQMQLPWDPNILSIWHEICDCPMHQHTETQRWHTCPGPHTAALLDAFSIPLVDELQGMCQCAYAALFVTHAMPSKKLFATAIFLHE